MLEPKEAKARSGFLRAWQISSATFDGGGLEGINDEKYPQQ